MRTDECESSVRDELENLIRQHLIANLSDGTSEDVSALDTSCLLIRFFNWRSRYVTAIPRETHVSDDLYASDAYKRHQITIDALIQRITDGQDLTPQLSKDVANSYVGPMSSAGGARRRRPDLDGLLAEWGIHHLHLSLDLGPDGFSARTRDLLFAVFLPEDAYLIAVHSHEAWAKRSLVETCIRSWPSAGLFHASRSVAGLNQETSEADHLKLRAAGVTTLMEIDGRVWAPRGQSFSGMQLQWTDEANKMMIALRRLAVTLNDFDATKSLIQDHGGYLNGQRPDVSAAVRGHEFGLKDSVTGVFVPWLAING